MFNVYGVNHETTGPRALHGLAGLSNWQISA
jgi:hypothetical protein